MKKTALILGAAVLAAAAGAQVYSAFFLTPPAPSKTKPLAELLPAETPGWEAEELPLGPTEALQHQAKQLLMLDEFVNRTYKRGARAFNVYVAYWKPGEMPIRLVNTHKPDRCWKWNGWSCAAVKSGVVKNARGQPLKPAEWRTFEKDGQFKYTYFWHLAKGQIHSYGGYREHPPVTFIFHDILKYGLDQKPEQYFIRLSSDQPLDNFWDDPGFQKILGDLAALGLAAAPPEKNEG